jgi:hypothetical protein
MVTTTLVLLMVEQLKVELHRQIMAFTEPSRYDTHMFKSLGMEIIHQVPQYALMIV